MDNDLDLGAAQGPETVEHVGDLRRIAVIREGKAVQPLIQKELGRYRVGRVEGEVPLQMGDNADVFALIVHDRGARAAQVGKALDHSRASQEEWCAKLDVKLPEMLLLRLEDAREGDNGAFPGGLDQGDGLCQALCLEKIQHNLLEPVDGRCTGHLFRRATQDAYAWHGRSTFVFGTAGRSGRRRRRRWLPTDLGVEGVDDSAGIGELDLGRSLLVQ
mmetsp:Transcript_16055/g.45980  ORF Transcript_16055/g.45980 Transcript_16055/m.45980 type:complete len:217 (+) Transcript_16055:1248-1898(+)